MQIHCLGTVGYHPSDHRHTSCYFLPQCGILLDAGTGVFRLAPYIQTQTLDVLLSHAHLDHTSGLTFLLDVLFQRPVERLRIWAESEKIAAVRDHLFHRLLFPAQLDAQWIAIDQQEKFQINGVQVAWRPQEHPGGSVAYRLDWQDSGKRLVYATDTSGDTSEAHVHWSRHADLLMHECYFRDSASQWAIKTGHCWSSRVAEVAQLSEPKKLLLTHINPVETCEDPVDIKLIREKVNCDVVLAEDGLKVDF